jgi:hypothetical protein
MAVRHHGESRYRESRNPPRRNTLLGQVLKGFGGSRSDRWNARIANDTAQALWLEDSDEKTREQKVTAAIDGLLGHRGTSVLART